MRCWAQEDSKVGKPQQRFIAQLSVCTRNSVKDLPEQLLATVLQSPAHHFPEYPMYLL